MEGNVRPPLCMENYVDKMLDHLKSLSLIEPVREEIALYISILCDNIYIENL